MIPITHDIKFNKIINAIEISTYNIYNQQIVKKRQNNFINSIKY